MIEEKQRSLKRCQAEQYAFSNSLMEETMASFRNHMATIDYTFVFRDVTGKYGNEWSLSFLTLLFFFFFFIRIIGLSSWRSVATANNRVRMIVQGKLRVAIEYRRRGLHIFAGLAYYLREQLCHPLTTFIFISIASLYNFVSMKKRYDREVSCSINKINKHS